MNINNMFSHLFIVLFISDISDNKDTIESRKNSGLQINLIRDLSQVIVFTKKWISSSKNRCSRVKNSGNTSFSNRNSLLFHSLMNSDSVLHSHFIKLIDTDDSAISKNKSTTFKLELSSRWVFDNRCS
jgi:hypothetical protein